MDRELEKLEKSKSNDRYKEKRAMRFLILVGLFLLGITTLPAIIHYLKNFIAQFFG